MTKKPTSKEYDKMTFTTTVRAFSHTGHITLPVDLVGKRISVTIEVLKE